MYLASVSSHVTAIFVYKCIREHSKNEDIYIIYQINILNVVLKTINIV